MRSYGGAVVGLVLMLALASPAFAGGTVSAGAGTVTFTGTRGADHVAFSESGAYLLVAGSGIKARTGCARVSRARLRCAKSGLSALSVKLGAGDDRYSNASKFRATVDAGAGDDSLIPGSGGLADDLHGGAGTDTAHYETSELNLRITLDDQANDGPPGGTANVRTDVENVVTGSGNDQLIGDDANNRLDGGSAADEITGKGGNDTLLGGGGPDVITATDGSVDAIDCGAAVDTARVDATDTQMGCEGSRSTVTPQLPATVQGQFRAGARTLVRKLVVNAAPPPASIHIACSGKRKGCPFKAKTVTPAGADTSITKLFRSARLRPGAVIEIRVTQPGTIGKVFRFTIRKKRSPASKTLCLAPGANAPSACS